MLHRQGVALVGERGDGLLRADPQYRRETAAVEVLEGGGGAAYGVFEGVVAAVGVGPGVEEDEGAGLPTASSSCLIMSSSRLADDGQWTFLRSSPCW